MIFECTQLTANKQNHKPQTMVVFTVLCPYLQVSVNDRDSEIEGLLQEGEPQVDLDQPVDQYGTHLGIDVRLVGKVGGLHTEFSLQ